MLAAMTTVARRYGAQSMTVPLRDVLVKRPGAAFGAAFDDPAHGFLHPVDLEIARREHDAFVDCCLARPARPRPRDGARRRPTWSMPSTRSS